MHGGSPITPPPARKQSILLLQAIVAIVFSAIPVFLVSSVFPVITTGIINDGAELYFVAAIANLVFIHTFDLFSHDARAPRLLVVTALGSTGISLLISCSYFFIASLR